MRRHLLTAVAVLGSTLIWASLALGSGASFIGPGG